MGVERRAAGREEDSGWEEGNKMAGEPREELLKTFWLATSNKRLWWWRKSAPMIETETGASWNIQSKLQDPKRRGLILEPSAVRMLTLEVEQEAGAGNNEMETLESTRKRGKITQRRSLEQAGKEKGTTCRPAIFPTRNIVLDTS